MKLRTSFFNWTALRKDILRFFPVWALYTIGGLLISVNVLGSKVLLIGAGGIIREMGSAAKFVGSCIGPFSIINLFYAMICGLVLFGDLFNSKLCNALHAMPLRREGWYLTHALSGIAFSFIPNLIISISMIPFLGLYSYVALFWLLGMTLEYLFFFGVAAFSAMCTGKRLAAGVVYLLINFLSILCVWFISSWYEPMLYGIKLDYTGFLFFSPVVWIVGKVGTLLKFEYTTDLFGDIESKGYTFTGLGSGWFYLIGIAAVGLVLLVLGLLLYRKRKLESAGDFMAFRPMAPVFSVIITLTVGLFFYTFGKLFLGLIGYVFLVIGIVVGYFISQMLLRRTVKVFHWKDFLFCGILCVATVGSIILTLIDPIGITRWTPNSKFVESVVITDSYENNAYSAVSPKLTLEEQGDIEAVINAHNQILFYDRFTNNSLFGSEYDSNTEEVYITYHMKDGREVKRSYSYRTDSKAGEIFEKYFSTPDYILGYDGDWDGYLEKVGSIWVDWTWEFTNENATSLLEAMKKDGEAGKLSPDRDMDYSYYINIEVDSYDYVSVYLYKDCTNTLQWLKQHGIYEEYY